MEALGFREEETEGERASPRRRTWVGGKEGAPAVERAEDGGQKSGRLGHCSDGGAGRGGSSVLGEG